MDSQHPPNPIRHARTSRGVMVAWVCKQLGVSRTRYWEWETGRGRPDVDNAMAICRLWPELTLDVIYGWFADHAAECIREAA